MSEAEAVCENSNRPTDHEWVVFSTCSQPVAIMVECSRRCFTEAVEDSTCGMNTPVGHRCSYLWKDGWRVLMADSKPSMRYVRTAPPEDEEG